MNDLTVKELPDGNLFSRIVHFKINCFRPVLAHSCEKYIEVLMKLYEKYKNIEQVIRV